MGAQKRVDLQQTGMQVAGTAGYLVQIVTAGVLSTTNMDALGGCDALKSDIAVTVDGTTKDGSAVTGFPISPGIWDPTAWLSISAIHGANANVWAGWYLGRISAS